MLDLKWINENPELLKTKLKQRNHSTEAVDKLLSIDSKRKEKIQQTETIRSKKNAIAKEVGEKKRKGEDASAIMSESTKLTDELTQLEAGLNTLQAEVDDILLHIPNVIDDSVPVGHDEKDNKEIHRVGEIPKYDFKPLDHHDLGVKLGILDFDRAARMTGARFCVLLGKAAKLERALINFMLDLQTTEHGYKEMLPPFMVNSKSLVGTNQLPKFKEDLFKLEGLDYFLIPTAEVPVTNFHREETLLEAQLPQLFTAYTPCFRSEAGSYGKDTKGLIRQHQFDKIELVMLAHPEQSAELHERLTQNAEEVLKRLELPFRRISLCSGDIGFGASKTYDLEVWLPGQNTYREISSCTNFKDFQARRANIRFKPKDGSKPRFVHTLNGSGLAVGRTLVAILENFQQKDGTVRIPRVLQKYTGFDSIEAS